jgi:hypothetical protein
MQTRGLVEKRHSSVFFATLYLVLETPNKVEATIMFRK